MNPALQKTDFYISTDTYQGPFELVLDLIEARKLLVNDLSLAEITDDFIQHVHSHDAFPVESTANFIQIAATLLLIKSKSLIPEIELTDEEVQDVNDLKRRLEAYERVRAGARELARIFGEDMLFTGAPRNIEVTFAPSRDTTASHLSEALAKLLAARKAVHKLPEAKVKPMITIEEMMDRLARRVESALTLSFKEFARNATEKVEIIVSFLALLELVKQGAVEVEQGKGFDDIRITHTATKVPRYGA